MNVASIGVSEARAGSKSAAAAGDLARKEEEKSFKAEGRGRCASATRTAWKRRRRKRDSRLIISDEFSQRFCSPSTASLRIYFFRICAGGCMRVQLGDAYVYVCMLYACACFTVILTSPRYNLVAPGDVE